MKKLEEIKSILIGQKETLRQNYNIKSISIFGSYAKGKQKPTSDIDILVEFEKPISLLKFIELENYLSNILGIKVDLVVKKALKPHIKEYVLKEEIPL